MTDRELLELAAKAAGVSYVAYGLGGIMVIRAGYDAEPLYWNPLRHDGEALRLEVRLKLLAVNEAEYAFAESTVDTPHSSGTLFRREVWYRDTGGDELKARRLASTMVAAEIGKAMP